MNLSRCNGKIVNQAEWINSINRREENLSSDQVTVLLQELHHNMSSGAVTHHYDVVKVQLETTVQPTAMQLLLHVLHSPVHYCLLLLDVLHIITDSLKGGLS